jgi:hypothetical protein
VLNGAGSKHHVIVDGLRYELKDGETGRWDVGVAADVRTKPPTELLPRIKDSLEFSMVFAEALVSDQEVNPKSEIQSLAAGCFKWIAEMIPESHGDIDLIDLRVRALDLGNTAAEPTSGVFVPILPLFRLREGRQQDTRFCHHRERGN